MNLRDGSSFIEEPILFWGVPLTDRTPDSSEASIKYSKSDPYCGWLRNPFPAPKKVWFLIRLPCKRPNKPLWCDFHLAVGQKIGTQDGLPW